MVWGGIGRNVGEFSTSWGFEDQITRPNTRVAGRGTDRNESARLQEAAHFFVSLAFCGLI